jgi:pyridoxine 4-dehydrogenase
VLSPDRVCIFVHTLTLGWTRWQAPASQSCRDGSVWLVDLAIVWNETGENVNVERDRSTKLRLGDTEIARIGLGTNRLANIAANVAFVKDAVAAGVGMIDTAHGYTGGESEETIGAALSPDPDRAVVATKGGGGGPGRGRPEILHAEIDESLRRLRTERITLYYLHRVDPETPLEESLAAIKEHRDRGRIRLVGVSQVSIDEIERARRIVPIAAVQNRYNLSERTHEAVVDYCAKENILFVPFFPLRGDGGRALAEIAARHRVTPRQIALAWLLRRSPTMLPIPGTLNLDHLKENVAALQIELSDGEFEALR